ncbi:MAG: hypothetical protein KAI64_07200 [Thermoplasmata archaeon]|nr:hypothetical protein [Thermoplasmata archaeon]
MAAIDNVAPKTVDRNVSAIMMYMQDMEYCTQTTMGKKLGMSPSMAGTYLNEAVERNLLVLGPHKKPIQYSLPSNGEKAADDKKHPFKKTGKNQALTIYMDEATCNKFKALSVLRKGSMYGGQGQLITMLIEQEFDKIPTTHHGSLMKLVERIEEAEEIKREIPLPVEWS